MSSTAEPTSDKEEEFVFKEEEEELKKAGSHSLDKKQKKKKKEKRSKQEEASPSDPEHREQTRDVVIDIEMKPMVAKEGSTATSTPAKDDLEQCIPHPLHISLTYTQQLRKRLGTKASFVDVVSSSDKKKTQPVTLTWNDVCYTIPPKKKVPEKKVLINVSGCVKPGQLLAIMGASGAGKTTLLNVLAGRIKGNITGQITINGNDIVHNRKLLKLLSGYVMQDDTMMPNLTVRETLMFSASLRLPESISKKEKEERVQTIIEELGLRKCANSLIGSALRRGISGGERKRVNIGVEMITDPSLLFLDEPTSGLDAFTSYSIMETLVGLAKSGRTIVCTIHQPRSNIFSSFDKLLLLSEGQVAYFGDAIRAVDYFSRLNFRCPTYVNPADYFLDILSVDAKGEDGAKEAKQTAQNFITEYTNSNENKQQQHAIQAVVTNSQKMEMPFKRGFATNYLTQWMLLSQRALKNFYRDKVVNIIRLVSSLLFAVIVGLIYLQIDNDQSSIGDRTGVLFFVITNQAFPAITGVLNEFPTEKAVFIRERAARMYRVSPYFLSKTITEIPGQLFPPILFGIVSYWMIGLQADAGKFFTYIAVILLINFVCTSLGLLISAASPNLTAANALAPITIVVFMLFGGFFINLDMYFIWLQYMSFFKYAFTALNRNEFEGLTLTCTPEQYIEPGHICPKTTGEQQLDLLGMHDSKLTIGNCCLILLGMGVFYRLLAYFALRATTKKATV